MLNRVMRASVLVLLLSDVSWGADHPSVSAVPALQATTRGQTVNVQGDSFPAQGVGVFLRRGTEKPGDKGIALGAAVASDGKSLSFKLPADHFETGRYLVYIAFDSTELAVPGDLTVLPDQAAKVQIDSIFPATDYRSDNDDGYDFDISGTNLGQAPNDNILEVIGAGPQPVGTAEECKDYATAKIFKKICLSYEPAMETRRLSVKGFHPAHYEGSVEFRLRVNGNVSETKQVTFSGITETDLRVLATVVSLVLGAVVLALVWQGIGVYKIRGEAYAPAASFFLDKQTNSYSLSKFQLLAWTGVAVFSYIFVFFCRMLIQWNFTFPAIPSGWPTLLGLSAGTTVAAVGITSNRGSKGAGPISPSMADFISSGGLVMSDRFQFFVWTLVGCAGFLALVLSHDPSTLKDLPEVPDGFLYLMGISATGYLGGKLVRLPGPVVTQLLVAGVVPADAGGPPARMTINIKGDNLSQNALVKVDDDGLRPDQFSIEAVKAQDQAPDSSFCSEINLTLKDASAYLEGEHNLTLTNKDGQMAACSFPVDPITIDPIPDLTASDQPGNVQVNGKNFAAGMTAQWTNGAGVTATIAAPQVKEQSATQLSITMTPGPKGEGALVLISAINLRASAKVNVRPAPPAA
jgi:hypothetical protein